MVYLKSSDECETNYLLRFLGKESHNATQLEELCGNYVHLLATRVLPFTNSPPNPNPKPEFSCLLQH